MAKPLNMHLVHSLGKLTIKETQRTPLRKANLKCNLITEVKTTTLTNKNSPYKEVRNWNV
jgi:hypothetical protein